MAEQNKQMTTGDIVGVVCGVASDVFRFMTKSNMTASSDKIDDLLKGDDDDDD